MAVTILSVTKIYNENQRTHLLVFIVYTGNRRTCQHQSYTSPKPSYASFCTLAEKSYISSYKM